MCYTWSLQGLEHRLTSPLIDWAYTFFSIAFRVEFKFVPQPRKSLGTRDRGTALVLAKRWALVFEDVLQAYEHRPADYAHAIQALLKLSTHKPIEFNSEGTERNPVTRLTPLPFRKT